MTQAERSWSAAPRPRALASAELQALADEETRLRHEGDSEAAWDAYRLYIETVEELEGPERAARACFMRAERMRNRRSIDAIERRLQLYTLVAGGYSDTGYGPRAKSMVEKLSRTVERLCQSEGDERRVTRASAEPVQAAPAVDGAHRYLKGNRP